MRELFLVRACTRAGLRSVRMGGRESRHYLASMVTCRLEKWFTSRKHMLMVPMFGASCIL